VAPVGAWTHLRGQVLMVRSELAYGRRVSWEPDLRAALALGLDAGNELLASAAYANLHQFLTARRRRCSGTSSWSPTPRTGMGCRRSTRCTSALTLGQPLPG
jgi:hypothetical protein